MNERIDYESPGYYRRQLESSRTRLQELEDQGVAAMSRYDVEICHGGDGEAALTEAKWLVGNHVAYFSRRLEKLGPEPPKQAVLFEMPE